MVLVSLSSLGVTGIDTVDPAMAGSRTGSSSGSAPSAKIGVSPMKRVSSSGATVELPSAKDMTAHAGGCVGENEPSE